eukprot:130992-Chlamydomonas_euryale.AAC.4
MSCQGTGLNLHVSCLASNSAVEGGSTLPEKVSALAVASSTTKSAQPGRPPHLLRALALACAVCAHAHVVAHASAAVAARMRLRTGGRTRWHAAAAATAAAAVAAHASPRRLWPPRCTHPAGAPASSGSHRPQPRAGGAGEPVGGSAAPRARAREVSRRTMPGVSRRQLRVWDSE